MTDPSSSRIRSGLTTAEKLLPFCLTALFLFISTFVMGINLGDDSWYLSGGTTLTPSAFIHFQDWAPLYSLWFYLLAFVCPNPVARYFFSWGLLVILLSLIPHWLKIPGAWFYTFILVSIPLLTVNPFVSLFAAVFLLLTMCLLLGQDLRPSRVAATACIVSFIAGFIRAEYDYGVYVCAVATLIALAVENFRPIARPPSPDRTSRLNSPIVIGITVASLSVAMFSITRHIIRPRSGKAFAQHFNMRAQSNGELNESWNSWRSTYALKRFGIDPTHDAATTTTSVMDFYHANRHLFLGHVCANLTTPLTLALLVFLLIVVPIPWIRSDSRSLRSASLFLALMSVPPLLGILVIYPRWHYFIILVPAGLIFALQLLRPGEWIKPSFAWTLLTGASLMWLLNIGSSVLENAPVSNDRRDFRRVQCANTLDKTASRSTRNVFDSVGIVPVYFNPPRNIVTQADLPQWSQFHGWTASARPAWISTGWTLIGQYQVTPQQLEQFLNKDLGYTAHPCHPDAQLTIYTDDRR